MRLCVVPLDETFTRVSLYTATVASYVGVRSERQAGDEHVLDERRRGHQVLELQVEYPLQPLHAQRTQLRQFGQQPGEVVRLALRVRRAVRDVLPQRVDDLHLDLFRLLGLPEPVPFCGRVTKRNTNGR